MAVLAIFKYDVKPGRFDDFMAKLQAAADPVSTVQSCRSPCDYFAARFRARIPAPSSW